MRLILILSQTFYTNINNERKYLSDELRKEKIFNISVLWKELIYSNIEDEFNRFFENLKKVNPNKDKNKINQYKEEIYFAQIIPFIGAMKSFAVKTEEIGATEEAELTKGLKSLKERVGKVAKSAKKVVKIK